MRKALENSIAMTLLLIIAAAPPCFFLKTFYPDYGLLTIVPAMVYIGFIVEEVFGPW